MSDELRIGLAGKDQLRWGATDLTLVLEEARRRHDLSPVATVALGRVGAAAVLLQRLSTKRALRLTVDLRGSGPLERVFAEVDEGGRFRGFVGKPQASTEAARAHDGEIRTSDAIGTGLLRVLREEPSGAKYESQVALVSGEVGSDVAHYLEQSEQRQSAVMLGVLLRPSGVAAAGGLLIEALPGAPSDLIGGLEQNLKSLGSVSRGFEDFGIDGMISRVLEGLEPRLVDRGEIEYACSCTREGLKSHLVQMASVEVQSLVEDGRVVASCAYCGQLYAFSVEELLGHDRTN